MNNTAFCITGWHFPEEFYQRVGSIPDVDLYVVSHRKRSQVPGYVFDLVGEGHVLFRPNRGYDWGCYQQFLNSGLWKEYETLFFMHDDIQIHEEGFVPAVQNLLKNHAVIGNGLEDGPASHTVVRLHPYAYAHSGWKPNSITFEHNSVRGSFFATSRYVLEELGSFEVFWDLFGLNIEFGNWSTKASCGKLEAANGPHCFGSLSGTFGSSRYLTESYRGDPEESDLQLPGWKSKLYAFIKRASTLYIMVYFRERKLLFRALWQWLLRVFLFPFSGRI